VFRRQAGARGVLRFDRFVNLALYHPEVGYYRQSRPRVGRGPGTDFYTATTSGPIFGEMIIAACRALLPGTNPGGCIFVEIGAEPGHGILEGQMHPFGATRTITCGQSIELSGPCIVFSNELFDAQPFRRFVRQGGCWHEFAVCAQGDRLAEVLEVPDPFPAELPPVAPEGYVIDAPYAAAELLRQVARQPWQGLFMTCDYGRTWKELTESTPAGTARAYHAHVQNNQLLERPGEQDLTCHVCWDWLEAELEANGFQPRVLETHETFFIRHAAELISGIVAAEAGRFSRRKQALQQLLHPAHLGQKFQVLHALRQ